MRYLSFTILLLLSTSITSTGQDQIANFYKVDKALISVHRYATEHNYQLTKESIKSAEDQWNVERSKLEAGHECSAVDQLSICNVDGLFSILSMQLDHNSYKALKSYLMELIMELRDLRESTNIKSYPIDHLWTAYQEYQEMHHTVHDQMFGLREWFEFEDMVNGVGESLDAYSMLDDSTFRINYPEIDIPKHTLMKDKVNECFLNFIYSLDSGYTPDFEWPCDELGTALYDLILLYE